MKIVEVEWLDAGCERSSMTVEGVQHLTPMPRSNVGYLTSEQSDHIVVSFGWLSDREHNMEVYEDNLVIPIGMIMSIKTLKEDNNG